MIEGRPLPEADEWSLPFWEGSAAGELRIQRCASCKRLRHLPRPMCPHCRSLEWDSVVVSGRGRVYSWIVIHPPVMPAFKDRLPLPIALVELEEDPEIRVVGNLVDCPPERIAIGLDVEVTFERIAEDVVLPQWRPRSRGAR